MTMLEKIARAIHEAVDGGPGPEEHWRQSKAVRIRQARAAVEAMREPTNAMAEFTVQSIVGTEDRWQSAVRDQNCVREIWSAMVDVISKETVA